MKYKVIVGHPGKQHSFRLAVALKQKDILLSYITTIYDKDKGWMRVLKSIVGEANAKRAATRKCEELDDDDVIQYCVFSSLITLLLLRIDKGKTIYNKWNRWVSSRFGKKVAKYAIKSNANIVIMYDTNAAECFKYLKKKAPSILRIMDVSHANRIYEKKLFDEDMKLLPEWAENLYKEKRYLWKTDLRFIREENEFTNFFLVPSKYVKKSLLDYGINKEQIVVTPYGVDENKFKTKLDTIQDADKQIVYFLYVGDATETKGFGHLLIALNMVNEKYPGTDLHLVGGMLDPQINSKYGNHVVSHGYLQFDMMTSIYQQADVMVIPSLSEGMTLAGLEALCSGLPLICTKNSGINDLIVEGKNGFVVDVSNAEQIANRMIWFIENKERIPGMKKEAYNTGTAYSWNRYYNEISNKILHILEGKQ